MRFLLAASLLLIALPAGSPAQSWTIALELEGQAIEGTPLNWSDRQVHLLARDGRLFSFAPEKATDFRKLSNTFRSYSQSEIRGGLQAEFGRNYQVSGTGHYLVVHPAGQRDKWAERFETLYRSFHHYFAARGMEITSPTFPLVAVAFPTAHDFYRQSAKEGARVGRGVLGYYSPITNRVYLYDQTTDGADWSDTADTIIHEAAHQSAFNTGVHNRFAATPRWVVEGLGTLFEAPGVWNCLHRRSQEERINRGRWDAFRHYASTRRRTGALAELVASDRMFQIDPDGAYAESWALTFYLSETQPAAWCRYLAKTAAKEPFEEVSPQERLEDFSAEFGANLALVEARFLRFIDQLESLRPVSSRPR